MTLKDYHERYAIMVHAYVLLDNHYHIVIETPRANLVKVMHGLNGGYTGYFNRKHNRVGHLFQGRYKAILVERESYLVELSRYVHLNPVRAGMVGTPEEYLWSSYPGYILKRKMVDWVEYSWVLGCFGDDAAVARKRYRAYVHAEVTESPLCKVYGQVVLGTEHFIEQSRKLIKGDISTEILARKQMQEAIEPSLIISSVAKSFGVDEAAVLGTGKRGENAARNAAMYIMKRYTGLGNNEIGAFFGGLHYSGVSKICTRLSIQMDKDKQLEQMVNEAISRIEA